MTKTVFRAILFASAAAISATPALAQDAESESGGVEEIIVTAQKRSENVQDVPIAVAAFGGEQLREKGVDNVSQLSNLTPSVQLSQSSQFLSSPSVLSGFIRGIGQDDFAANFEAGVGTYIDGVFLARNAGSNVDLMDVQRVEILKGPQGTLFGRNTIGGAISVVTRDPGDKFAFSGQVTGGRFNRIEAGGVIDLPISPTARASIAFSHKSRDGFQKRIPFPGASGFVFDADTLFPQLDYREKNTSGGNNEQSVRGKLVVDASDRVKLTLSADYTHGRSSGTAAVLLDVAQTAAGGPGGLSFAGFYNACINTPAFIIAVVPALAQTCTVRANAPNFAGVNADAITTNDRLPYDNRFVTGNFDTTYARGPNNSYIKNYGFMGQLDFELSDNVSLKSITAYRDLYAQFGQSVGGSPVQDFEATVGVGSKQFSQEFQLTGKVLDDKLDFLLGAYYFNEKARELENVIFPGALFQINGKYLFNTKSYAAFAHINYRVSDLIGITLGARYTSERKTLDGSQQDLNQILTKAGVPAFLFPIPADTRQFYNPNTQRLKFNNFSPRIGIEVHPSEDVMIYGSFAKGFKSGGWTTRIAFPDTPDPTLPADKQAPSFAPEKADTFELGFKSQFANRKLQLNAALFHTDYKGIQLQIQRGASPSYENAGDARIQGFEVEAVFAPSRSFHLNAAVGYIDAKYKRVDDPAGVITLRSRLPRIPEWSFSLSPEFNYYLANDGRITLRADYSHKSNVYNDVENTPALTTGNTNIVNASISYAAPGDRWSLTGGANNLFNERFFINGVDQRGGAGFLTGVPNRPVEWYVTARVKF